MRSDVSSAGRGRKMAEMLAFCFASDRTRDRVNRRAPGLRAIRARARIQRTVALAVASGAVRG